MPRCCQSSAGRKEASGASSTHRPWISLKEAADQSMSLPAPFASKDSVTTGKTERLSMAGPVLESGSNPGVDDRLVGDHRQDPCLAGSGDERQPLSCKPAERGSRDRRSTFTRRTRALFMGHFRRFAMPWPRTCRMSGRAYFGAFFRPRSCSAECGR